MSLETARKLGPECSRLWETPLPLAETGSLEPEIKSLETQARDVLRFLPSVQNVLAPVNRLYPEVISYIRFALGDDAIDSRSIIPPTHVCKYWRDSIISTPNSWKLISNQLKRLAALSLEHAKLVPPNIHLSLYKLARDPGFSDLLLPHIQYTGSLSVSGFDFDVVEGLTQLFRTFPNCCPASGHCSRNVGESGRLLVRSIFRRIIT